MENFRITFEVKKGEAKFCRGEQCAFLSKFDGKNLTIQLTYDFRETPLTLQAEANEGDSVSITVRPYRIECRVNGALTDEEWPVGSIDIQSDSVSVGDYCLKAEEIAPENADTAPDYIRRGIRTDEIRMPGVNIGDCIPFSDDRGVQGDGLYHLFYLYDRHHHRSKWGFGAHQWAHVSTRDLRMWDEHPMAIAVTEQYEGSICTGSVGFLDGKYYAWYAIRMSDRSPARMTYAVSEDSVHFRKTNKYFTLPAQYEPTSARDPKVVFLDGKVHLFITTTLLSTGNGCLAHLVSDHADMSDFTDCGPIFEHENKDQPECPDWFKMGTYYYLVYSIRGSARYLVSRKPFSEWNVPEDNTIPCGYVPKSATLNGRRIFSGFVNEGGYAGHLVMAEARQNADGTLQFTDLEA